MSVLTENGASPWSGRLDREWHEWMVSEPPNGKLIRFKRPEWPVPTVCTREEIDPEFNVCGVYWQVTGVANEDKP